MTRLLPGLCCFSFLLAGVFCSQFVSVMEGDSVTLSVRLTETQIKDGITWRFGPRETLIARMKDYKTTVYNDDRLDGRFKNKLHLNNQTGSLTITNTNITHTGLYNITTKSQDKALNIFNITVYAYLPIPVISSNSSQCSSSSSNCSLLCSVLNLRDVRDVSLSWYKGKSLLSIISVSDLNIRLSLSLEVEYQDTNTYRCVLNNTITNQTQHLNINDVCQICSAPIHGHIVVICCVVVGCLMFVTAVLIFWIYRKHKATS
ncbi:uncharacterized protein [Misgurnus anguillicaudatus]|uniref:uncharacterized protein n=1 Tax=Misgurnus anguillicaudatus TaxID=75329 RepID=UPI003CCFA16E